MAAAPPLHPSLAPLSWLLGHWQTDRADGHYPTIRDFSYSEHLHVFHVGQPNLQFEFYSCNSQTSAPMHREVGFVKIQPNSNKLAFICAMNSGLCELSEGEVKGQEFTLESHTLGRASIGIPPATTKINRCFKLEGDKLRQIVHMETERTPLTEHLSVTYSRVQ